MSVVIAAALFTALRLIVPDIVALAATLPFLAVAVYAVWRQWRTPSVKRVSGVLDNVRGMSWEHFSTLIEEGFRQDGYSVTQLAGNGADFELARSGRSVVVNCKRWKVAQTGVIPLRDLLEAMKTRQANDCIYVSAGHFTAHARKFATEKSIQLVDDAALVELVARAARGKKKKWF